jgi:hypothetical protein
VELVRVPGAYVARCHVACCHVATCMQRNVLHRPGRRHPPVLHGLSSALDPEWETPRQQRRRTAMRRTAKTNKHETVVPIDTKRQNQ